MATPLPAIQRQFLAHQHRLMAYVLGLLRDPNEAEDCFQDVALVILNHTTGPDDPEAFGAWARGIARNHALKVWRSRRRSRVIACDALMAAVEQAFDEADGSDDGSFALRAALAACLDILPVPERELLTARFVDGRQPEELAPSWSKSPNALRMLLLRLRQKMKTCVEGRIRQVPA